MEKRTVRKLRRIAAIYAAAAMAVLAVLASVLYSRLERGNTAARYSYELSFEQSAAAAAALSETLEQCRYATGSLCCSLASDAWAESCAARSALATLPFSTVELEQTDRFLGSVGEFVHGICVRGREFSDDERADVLALSDTAYEFSRMLLEMRDALGRGELEMDSRERPLANVLPRSDAPLLSSGFAEMEGSFPETAELRTLAAADTAAAPVYADASAARRTAAKLLGVSEELPAEVCRYSDGTYGFSLDSVFVRAGEDEVVLLSDSRLVCPGEVSEKRALEKAKEFLASAGVEGMSENGREKRGGVIFFTFVARSGDAICPDCTAEVGVALDNCGICYYCAPTGETPDGELEWPLSAEDAAAALPDALNVLGSRRLILDGKPCYEFSCSDGSRSVKICVDAEYGRELSIEVERVG